MILRKGNLLELFEFVMMLIISSILNFFTYCFAAIENHTKCVEENKWNYDLPTVTIETV